MNHIRWVLLFALAALAACSAERPVAATEPPTTVLHAARILVAPDAPPIDNGVVLLRGGKIVAVGPRGSVAVPPHARESACGRDGVVAAGFQNSHVHFIGSGSLGGREALRQGTVHHPRRRGDSRQVVAGEHV